MSRAIFQTFRWLVKPQRRLSGRCWLLIPKVNLRHMYYRLFSVICLWSGLATELNFKVFPPDAAFVSLNYCGWWQNCRQPLEGAARCSHSANSNEAATGSQAKGTHRALSEVSADEELTADRGRQISKQMKKRTVTDLITELTKCSGSTEIVQLGKPSRGHAIWNGSGWQPSPSPSPTTPVCRSLSRLLWNFLRH